ncbi:hypothetical protein [Flammeovirga agarivorans]|uniref:Uncharacterized protein n=1 Tax=Flammeovirga agarivorans TaxID=2726742 RepID=A0A7X8XVW4_9BACT|nr:hypothetical protein [Flammeovirga agarivorans]NLR91681.1 hypothetical protein [Flammeovirga agarivorans]
MELSAFVLILLALNGIFICFDSWLLKNEKKKLYHFLVESFIKIDDVKVPHIHKHLAKKVSSKLDELKIFGIKKYGFGSYALISSVILTITSYLIGSSIDRVVNSQFLKNENYIFEAGFFVPYFLIAVIANATFDITSLSISRFHIRTLGDSGYLKFILIILKDLACAFILSLILLDIVFYFSLYFDSLRIGIDVIYPNIFDVTKFHIKSIFNTVFKFQFDEVLSLEKVWIPFSYIIYSVSTFIPTLLFLTFLSLVYIIKVLISMTKSIVLRYINRVTDDEEENIKPFTLIGVTLTLIAAILKVVIEYNKP